MVEVCLSAQFTPIDGFTAAHTGLLWHQLRQEFPIIEQHSPLDHATEVFGQLRPLVKPNLTIRMLDGPPVPRIFFKTADGSQLIQIQEDRFIHNWRKVGEGEEYPRYERIRDRFEAELRNFEKFASEQKLGRLLFDQCEVTYVNHIFPPPNWTNLDDLYRIVPFWGSMKDKEFVPEPEHVAVNQRFLITEAEQAVGRLHMDLTSAHRVHDKRFVLVMNLLARLKPEKTDIEGVIDRLNTGRKWIVKTFKDVTTPEMHSIWGEQK